MWPMSQGAGDLFSFSWACLATCWTAAQRLTWVLLGSLWNTTPPCLHAAGPAGYPQPTLPALCEATLCLLGDTSRLPFLCVKCEHFPRGVVTLDHFSCSFIHLAVGNNKIYFPLWSWESSRAIGVPFGSWFPVSSLPTPRASPNIKLWDGSFELKVNYSSLSHQRHFIFVSDLFCSVITDTVIRMSYVLYGRSFKNMIYPRHWFITLPLEVFVPGFVTVLCWGTLANLCASTGALRVAVYIYN